MRLKKELRDLEIRNAALNDMDPPSDEDYQEPVQRGRSKRVKSEKYVVPAKRGLSASAISTMRTNRQHIARSLVDFIESKFEQWPHMSPAQQESLKPVIKTKFLSNSDDIPMVYGHLVTMKQEKSRSKAQDTHEIQLWIDQLDKDGDLLQWVAEMLQSSDAVLADHQENLENQLRFIKKHRETCNPRVKALNLAVEITTDMMPTHDNSVGLHL